MLPLPFLPVLRVVLTPPLEEEEEEPLLRFSPSPPPTSSSMTTRCFLLLDDIVAVACTMVNEILLLSLRHKPQVCMCVVAKNSSPNTAPYQTTFLFVVRLLFIPPQHDVIDIDDG